LAAQEHEHHGGGQWRPSLEVTAYLQYIQTSRIRGAYQFGSINRAMLQTGGSALGGSIRLRAMGSAEPVTLTERGAPQPLQVSFTSDGETITDRAHPSPWLMELAASYERVISEGGDVTVSLYAAAIGEAALGPPIYFHRGSAVANSAVPLGHHSQDVTHSSYGVVTAGVTAGIVGLEFSAFNDRQPEEPGIVFYYDGARLDSYAARATVTTKGGSRLSGFYGYLPAAGGGHHHDALHRFGAALTHDGSPWSFSLVYSANDPLGSTRRANTVLLEGARRWSGGHVLFARAEYVQRTDEELALIGSINALQDVEALQLGYAMAVGGSGMQFRVGGYTAINLVPPQLEPFYGTRTPLTLNAFGQVSWSSGR
jgi:hypothetical protein